MLTKLQFVEGPVTSLHTHDIAENEPSQGRVGKDLKKNTVVPLALPVPALKQVHSTQAHILQKQGKQNEREKEIVAESPCNIALQQCPGRAGTATAGTSYAGIATEPTAGRYIAEPLAHEPRHAHTQHPHGQQYNRHPNENPLANRLARRQFFRYRGKFHR